MGISRKDTAPREGGSAQSTSASTGTEDDKIKGELTLGEFRQIVSKDSKDWVIKLWHPDNMTLAGGSWTTVCNQEEEDSPYEVIRYRSKVDAELAMVIYFRDEIVAQKSEGQLLVQACFDPAIDWTHWMLS